MQGFKFYNAEVCDTSDKVDADLVKCKAMGATTAETEWPKFYQDKDTLTHSRDPTKQFTPRGAGWMHGID